MKYSRIFLLFAALSFLVPSAAFSYEPPEDLYRYLATVRRVIDGNTISADVDLGFGVWMHKTELRLVGVDVVSKEDDAKKSLAAHKYLHELLKDQDRLLIQTSYDPTGEYDGWYAKISIWDEDKEEWTAINQMVIDAGHGTAKK